MTGDQLQYEWTTFHTFHYQGFLPIGNLIVCLLKLDSTFKSENKTRLTRTEPAPSQAGNRNHDWTAHTENLFGMISNRWVTFIAGVGFDTRVVAKNLDSLRNNTDALPLRHCGRCNLDSLRYNTDALPLRHCGRYNLDSLRHNTDALPLRTKYISKMYLWIHKTEPREFIIKFDYFIFQINKLYSWSVGLIFDCFVV